MVWNHCERQLTLLNGLDTMSHLSGDWSRSQKNPNRSRRTLALGLDVACFWSTQTTGNASDRLFMTDRHERTSKDRYGKSLTTLTCFVNIPIVFINFATRSNTLTVLGRCDAADCGCQARLSAYKTLK
jgi:hypothetical protein